MQDDLISRQAVLDIDFKRIILTTAKPAEMIEQKVKALPPVTPQPKTGYWIPLGNYDDYGNESSYKCSECGDIDTYPDNYCPNCGAKMENNGERWRLERKMTFEEIKEIFKKSIDDTDTMNQAIENFIQSIYLKGYNDALNTAEVEPQERSGEE